MDEIINDFKKFAPTYQRKACNDLLVVTQEVSVV
jgi:hypothetical protein